MTKGVRSPGFDDDIGYSQGPQLREAGDKVWGSTLIVF